MPTSEGKLQRELHDARVVYGGVDGAEAEGVDVADRLPKLGMIKEVEEFRAEVQPHIFPGELELFDHGEIGVDEVRTVHGNAASVPQLTVRRGNETSRVDVLEFCLVGIGVATSDPVRAVEVIAIAAGVEGDSGRVRAVDEGVGEAGGDFLDQRQLPTTK